MIKRARAGVTAAFVTVMCAAAAVAATSAPAGASAAKAGSGALTPGNLLVSESVFTKAPKIAAGKTQLPPGCTGSNCVTAIANGSYPAVFNNALVDGSFGVWAITSTVSGGGDQGADPNKLVEITDPVAATSTASGESFQTLRAAGFGEVLRGVSFTPGSR